MDPQLMFRSRVDSGVELLEEDAPVTCVPREVTDLAEQLKSDRLIRVFIGAAARPYLVPQSTLARASESFVEGEEGVLNVPDGDQEVWKMLLFWLVKGEMSDGARGDPTTGGGDSHTTLELMVKCWVAGGTYKIPDFQQCAILHLLYWLDVPKVASHLEVHSHSGPFPWDVMRLAFQSSEQGSALRRVFAQAALDANYRLFGSSTGGGRDTGPHDMDALQATLEGIPGAMRDMIEASAHDARQRNGPKAPIRYRILQAPFPWSLLLLDGFTVEQSCRRPNGDQLLVSLRHALNLRIQTVVAGSKFSDASSELSDASLEIAGAAPAPFSKIGEEEGPRLTGGETKCEPM